MLVVLVEPPLQREIFFSAFGAQIAAKVAGFSYKFLIVFELRLDVRSNW